MASEFTPTPIETAYRELAKDRENLTASDLASQFVSSVKQLEKQLRGSGPFYPGQRTALADPALVRQRGALAGTDELAAVLWEPQRFKVGRRSELDFHYVDRELVAARALLSSGKAKISGTKLWLDLLLANANPADRTPIVAEAKLRYDKDPEAALVQGLAYAAQLGTPKQLRRLVDLYPDFFANRSDPKSPPTRLDIYVITYDMPPSRKPQLRRALKLAEGIVSDPTAAKYLRRIAFLEAAVVRNRLRFRCPVPPAEG